MIRQQLPVVVSTAVNAIADAALQGALGADPANPHEHEVNAPNAVLLELRKTIAIMTPTSATIALSLTIRGSRDSRG